MIKIDIGSKGEYPASHLSNFHPYNFVIDGVKCSSMEGFLQSLKFGDLETQTKVCNMVGFTAKKEGKKSDWQKTQMLYWFGKEMKRESNEYQSLLDRAFDELSKNNEFKKALLDTGDAILTHSIGKRNIKETVLTEEEFCSRLMKIRNE